MADNNENMIEFLRGQKTCTVTFTNQKHINRMKKLYEKYPECFERYKENEDGSLYARIPLKWLKISKPKEVIMTEEQRLAAAERLRNSRANKNLENNTDEDIDELEDDD